MASRSTTGKGIVTPPSETPEVCMRRQTGASVDNSVGTEVNRRKTKIHVGHGEYGNCGAQPIVERLTKTREDNENKTRKRNEMKADSEGRWKKKEEISRPSHSLSSSFQEDIFDSDSAEEMDQKHSKLGAKPNSCAHADWPKMSGDESFTTTMPPWRDHTLWRITTTRTVEGLSEQPRCGVMQQYEALLNKHAIEYTKLIK